MKYNKESLAETVGLVNKPEYRGLSGYYTRIHINKGTGMLLHDSSFFPEELASYRGLDVLHVCDLDKGQTITEEELTKKLEGLTPSIKVYVLKSVETRWLDQRSPKNRRGHVVLAREKMEVLMYPEEAEKALAMGGAFYERPHDTTTIYFRFFAGPEERDEMLTTLEKKTASFYPESWK